MSHAIAFSPQHLHPDTVRIAALSAAIALNLGMLLVATRPFTTNLIRPAPLPTPTLTIHSDPVPVPPQPAPPQLKPLPHRAPMVVPRVPMVTPEPSTFVKPAPLAIPVSTRPVTAAVVRVTAPTGPATPDATLAYLDAPPPTYPMQARRMHMQGTVMLRVLVDASGHPQQVQVMDSSGYPLLDRTARMQVLQHWRFHPAMVDGHAASAWARVPIHFDLRVR